MSIPGFNADATLYKTSGRYQTSRNMINLPTQMIYPAEVIEVHGCPPGFNLWEAGGDWGCDPEGPSGEVGGDGGGQPPGGGPPGGGPSGGGTAPPTRPPRRPRPPRPKPPPQRKYKSGTCSSAQLNTSVARACVEKLNEDNATGSRLVHQLMCDRGKVECCKLDIKTANIISCDS